MAYVIIKTDQQKAAETKVLKDFGINQRSATKEQREYAQEIARRTLELKKDMEARKI
jgi:hypothetical protein